SFRNDAKQLIVGDVIEAGGGIRKSTILHPKILNLEYFKPIKLAKKITYSNPECPNCKISMNSAGKGKGYRCKKCGDRVFTQKRAVEETRQLMPKRIYAPPLKAHRHLTKPKHRLSMKNKRGSIPLKLIDGWQF
ncbi:MAG: single stranded DNA-binding domain-containing protein, partial [Nitrososphaerales archaeon]